jgi:hypothetical protein
MRRNDTTRLEQARHRCRRRRRVSARAGPERRRTARSKQWRAERIQTRERQRHAGQGRARFERARERCGKAEASDAELLRKNRRRVAGLLREMRERDGIDPDYATKISGGARVAVSRTRARSLVRCTRSGEPEGKAAKRRWRPDATSWKEPRTTSSLYPCGGQGRSNAVRVRRAAQDRRWW